MKRLFIILLSLIILLTACKKSDNPVEPTPPSDTGGNIKTGTTVDIITQPISTGGGTIKITKPGDPLDGFEMTVPSNSFPSSKNFQISYAPIVGHNLGQYFNPASPLIKIKTDGSVADRPITIKVPIKLSTGSFAMGFFYDETTGKVEGTPIEDLTNNYVIVSTKNFSSRSNLGKGNNLISSDDATTNLVICSVLESVLNNQTIISSGFNPGVDDWEFINYGSYIAPGGHCAGQSMTAMWYFYEKKLKGQKSLFHAFDNINYPTNPKIMWMDNPLGYRFASTIQEDFNWGYWDLNIQVKSFLPKLNWEAFILSMLITGEPQFVLIRQSSPPNSAHAMIVYKVNVSEGKLYIADPNFPNNRDPNSGAASIRTIDFVNGKFNPYPSSLNAASSTIMFDQIGYFAKTKYINWNQIGTRWAEFENGSIGNDRFPGYELYINSTTGVPLIDNYYTGSQNINIVCKSSSSAQFIAGTDKLQGLDVYDLGGNNIASGNISNAGVASIKLKPGKNKLGFYIMGYKNNSQYFVDFKWLTINYNTLFIQPDPLKGKPGTDYTFYARTNGSMPSNAKLVWNFGDNTPEVVKNNDSTVVHKFQYDGKYIISVKLTDNSTGKEIATAYGNVSIESNYTTLFIEPEHLYGEPNKEYTFKARTNGNLPSNYKFTWGFGDGTPQVVKINDSTVTHTYTGTSNRDYDILVTLEDNSTGLFIKAAYAKVTIASGLMAKIKNAKQVGLDFIGDFKFEPVNWNIYFSIGMFLNLQANNYTLSWAGNNFTFSFNITKTGYFFDIAIVKGEIKGTVSSDGTTILSLNGYQITTTPTQTDSIICKIELNNLQYDHMLGDLVYYEARGPSVANRVNRIEMRKKSWSDSYKQWSEIYLKSVNYNSSLSIPILTVEFFPY